MIFGILRIRTTLQYLTALLELFLFLFQFVLFLRTYVVNRAENGRKSEFGGQTYFK